MSDELVSIAGKSVKMPICEPDRTLYSKQLRITISGLCKLEDGEVVGSRAEVVVYRDGKEILRDTFVGKVVRDYSRVYPIEQTGSPVTATHSTDALDFTAAVDFVQPEDLPVQSVPA